LTVGDSDRDPPKPGLLNPSWLEEDEIVLARPTAVLMVPDEVDVEALDAVLFRLLFSAHSEAKSPLDCLVLGPSPFPVDLTPVSCPPDATGGDGDELREISRELGDDRMY